MDDIFITVDADITEINITVEQQEEQDITVNIVASEGGTVEVDLLREELGDIDVDLLLNYNIAKTL